MRRAKGGEDLEKKKGQTGYRRKVVVVVIQLRLPHYHFMWQTLAERKLRSNGVIHRKVSITVNCRVPPTAPAG